MNIPRPGNNSVKLGFPVTLADNILHWYMITWMIDPLQDDSWFLHHMACTQDCPVLQPSHHHCAQDCHRSQCLWSRCDLEDNTAEHTEMLEDSPLVWGARDTENMRVISVSTLWSPLSDPHYWVSRVVSTTACAMQVVHSTSPHFTTCPACTQHCLRTDKLWVGGGWVWVGGRGS